MSTQPQILVVDDERIMRDSLAAWLMEDGYAVDVAASGPEGIELAGDNEYAIHFVDLKMPGVDGLETLRELRKARPEACVVIITAYATVDTAVAAMKEGAHEYLVKPCNPKEVSLLVERIIALKRLEAENAWLRQKLSRQWRFHDIVSKNPKMQSLFELVQDVSSLRSTVLVQGESGTGKEMIARAVHHAGERADKPFVAVSCAALTDSLLESELFGHERGAFTGAAGRRKGKFEQADGGTLFLDEIADVPARVQVELLRVLQERRFYRVGGSEEVEVDVRIIAATHADLQQEVSEGRFREDLYYRLNVIHLRIPPLRARREDVPLLARHFVERAALEQGRPDCELSDAAVRLLMAYDWPGNVRELENAVERAVVTCRDRILDADDFAFLREQPSPRGWQPPTDRTLQDVEKEVITATLHRNDGNIRATAQILGIDRSTLYDKIRKYEIPRRAG